MKKGMLFTIKDTGIWSPVHSEAQDRPLLYALRDFDFKETRHNFKTEIAETTTKYNQLVGPRFLTIGFIHYLRDYKFVELVKTLVIDPETGLGSDAASPTYWIPTCEQDHSDCRDQIKLSAACNEVNWRDPWLDEPFTPEDVVAARCPWFCKKHAP